MTELHQDEWNEQRLAAANAVLLDVRTEDDVMKNIFRCYFSRCSSTGFYGRIELQRQSVLHLLSFWR